MNIKNIVMVLLFAFSLVSCAIATKVVQVKTATPSFTPTKLSSPTNTLTRTITSTITPLKRTATWTPSPTPMPTLTHLPLSILGDILKTNDDNTGVNQYGWYIEGFDYKISSDLNCVHTGQYGLQIKPKTVETRDSFWAFHYSHPLDTTKIKYLIFWVKGVSGNEIVHVWITVNYDAELEFYSDKYVDISASEWRQVKIQLPNSARFRIFEISYFNFAVNSDTDGDSVCIDDISFTP